MDKNQKEALARTAIERLEEAQCVFWIRRDLLHGFHGAYRCVLSAIEDAEHQGFCESLLARTLIALRSCAEWKPDEISGRKTATEIIGAILREAAEGGK